MYKTYVLLLLFNKLLKCWVNKLIVLNIRIYTGLKNWIFLGGLFKPSSIDGTNKKKYFWNNKYNYS